ncbi:MAG: hypothetical protein LBG75_01010 [Candidatus Nomurabacteria bacterium]|nr:hypothetical protein [Candidatus Nomurabacteria bacterium]
MAKDNIIRYFNQRNELDKLVVAGDRDPEVIRPHLQAIIDGTALQTKTIPWSPVCTYVQKIAKRNAERDWGLTDTRLLELAVKLQDHAGPLQPESITLTLGKGLAHDWAEAAAWAKDALAEIGVDFTDYPQKNGASVKLYGDITLPNELKLAPAHLDLKKYWDRENGTSADQVRAIGQRLTTLEAYWLLCLNPEVWDAIDYETMPGLISPGVVVGDDNVLSFERDSVEAYVNDNWSVNQWHDYSTVAFRG